MENYEIVPVNQKVEVLSKEHSRVEDIHTRGLVDNNSSWGIFRIDMIPYRPKNLFEAVKKTVVNGPQGLYKLKPSFDGLGHNFSEGDILLDLDTKRRTQIKDKIPEFDPKETFGNVILIKNGLKKEKVVLFDEKGNRTIEERETTDGRVGNFEVKSFFKRSATVGNRENGGFSMFINLMGTESSSERSFQLTAKELENVMLKQSSVAVRTKDNQLLLPQTIFFGDLVIADPQKLANHIVDEGIFNSKESSATCAVGEDGITLAEISWSIIHSTLTNYVSNYTSVDIFESQSDGVVKRDVQKEIYEKIDKALEEIGIDRVPQKVDIRDWNNGRKFVDIGDNNPMFRALLAADIAEELKRAWKVDPNITQVDILGLNPNLRSSKDVNAPSTLKLFGFPYLVNSIYWYPEIPREEWAGDFSKFLESSANHGDFNEEWKLKDWLNNAKDEINGGYFPQLEENRLGALFVEDLPDTVNWWSKFLRAYKENHL